MAQATETYEVLAVEGQAFIMDPEGNLRQLEPGDTVREGQMIFTDEGGMVQLAGSDGVYFDVAVSACVQVEAAGHILTMDHLPDDLASLLQGRGQGEEDPPDGEAGELSQPPAPPTQPGGNDNPKSDSPETQTHGVVRVPRTPVDLDLDTQNPGGVPRDVNETHEFDERATLNPRVADAFDPDPDAGLIILDEVEDPYAGAPDETDPVAPVNQLPFAVDDINGTDEDSILTVGSEDGVLSNDDDPDNLDVLVVEEVNGNTDGVGDSVGGDNGGSFTINPDGSYTFDPGTDFQDLAEGEETTTSVTYTVSDGEGGTDEATLTVTVTGVNDTPTSTSIPDQVDADANGVSVDVSGYFDDADTSDSLSYSVSGLPEGLTIDPDTGLITGTVDNSASQGGPGSDGVYSVTVTVEDGNGGTTTQTFDWTVTNPAPEAVDDTDTTTEDASLTVGTVAGVLDDDSDPDGDDLTVSEVEGVAGNVGSAVTGDNGGSFTLNGDGSYTFDPGSDFQDLAAGEQTTTSVTYTVSDGEGGTDEATLTVTVTGVNDAPTSTSITDQSDYDSDAVSVDVSGFFSDVDTTDSLSYSVSGLPLGLDIDPDTGLITGTIDNSASQGGTGNDGIYSVTVAVSDGNGGTTSQTFDWTVANPAPDAVDDTDSTDEDTSITTGNVITGSNSTADSDPDGDDLTVLEVNQQTGNVGNSVTGDNGGTFTIGSDGSYTFDPGSDFHDLAAGEQTTTSITYTVSDGEGGTDTATLTVTVTGVNDAPTSTAIPDQADLDATADIDLDVSGYFSDTDSSDSLTYSVTGLPEGLLINSSTGEITGTIDNSASQGGPGSDGLYSVTVTVSDGNGGTTSQTFDWAVTNPAPEAVDDTDSTDEDTSLTTGNVITGSNSAADSDPDGDNLSVIEVDDRPANVGTGVPGDNGGSFVINTDGSYTFDPGSDFEDLAAGETRDTVVNYTVSDGEGGTDTASLTVTVTGVNDAPTSTAIPDQADYDADGVSVDVSGYFSDVDATNTLTYSASDLPAGLSIDSATGVITGTVDNSASQGGTNGVYSVTVTASDGHGGTTTQTFDWTVANPAPDAVDDTDSTDEDTSITTGNVITGSNSTADSDPDGDDLTVLEVNQQTGNVGSSVTGDNGGTFTIDSDGSYTFDPGSDFQDLAADQTATTSVTYVVSDGEGGTDTATLTVTVTGVNDAPTSTAIPDQADFDADGISLSVSGYFADADTSDTLTYSATGLPDGLSINSDTGIITGTIDNSASQAGPFSVTVTASDGNGGTVDGTFTWTVSNPSPIADPDTGTTDEDTELVAGALYGVLPDDVDPDGDSLSVTQYTNGSDTVSAGTSVTGTNGGSFTINSNGSYTFAPGNDFQELAVGQTATTSVTYTVSDGEGGTDTTTLTITITGTNDAPVAVADTAAVSEDGTDQSGYDDGSVDTTVIAGTVFGGAGDDSDIDNGDTFTVTGVAAGTPGSASGAVASDVTGTYGTVSINADGSYTYDLDNTNGDVQALAVGETLTDTFTYTITDSEGATSTTTLTVTVNGTNDAPDITVGGGDSIAEGVTETDTTLTASGTLTLSDVDTSDSVTTSVVNTVTTGGTYSGPVPDSADLLTMFGATGDLGGTQQSEANGIAWTFDSGSEAFDEIPAGETLTLTYTVEVEDPHGATDTQDVTITITGTNDAPVAVADTASVSEDGTDQSGHDDGSAATTVIAGDVFDNDSDVDDTFEVTGVAAGTPASADGSVGAEVTGTYGTVSLNADGSYTYDLDNTNGDVQALAVGETLTDTFTYTITDSEGATSTTTLTVTVNGTNDAPDITVGGGDSIAEGVTETDTTLTASGTLTLSDVDTSDSVTTSVVNTVTTGGTYSGPVPDSADLLTMFGATGDLGGTQQSEANGIAWTFDSGSEAFDEIPAGETLTLTYTVEVEDPHGATDTQNVTVTITGTNDEAVASDDTATATEDTTLTGNVLDNDSDPDHATTLEVTCFSVDGDPTGYSAGDTATITDVGTLTIGSDGAYTFVPNADYSGPVPEVTYTVSDGTVSDTGILDITGVTPVSDAPGLTVDDTTLSTNEDTSVALGLNAPTVTDNSDDNGASIGDNPELLGPITLSGIPDGAQLLDGTDSNAALITSDGSPITVVLSDGSHVTGATGDLTLTTAQYEALLVNPPADSGDDFTVTVSVTEYEVTDAGTQIPGVPGATTTETIDVDVQAVTDTVDLQIDGGDTATITVDEDVSFNLTDHLTSDFQDALDGSEGRDIVITGLPSGTVVNGTNVTTGTITIPLVNGNTLPEINITAPENFSGDIDNITVTLNATDTDGDSLGTINTESDSVTLNLHVDPVAGDITVGDVTTAEDTGVTFLASLDVTDTDGSEDITGITVNSVPSGWVISDGSGNALFTGNGTSDFTVPQVDVDSDAYQNYIITPPAHSSADETLSVDVTTTDTASTGTDTITSFETVEVTVTPVAEQVGVDTDGDGSEDLTMNGDFAYTTHGAEDTWFSLDGTDGFDLDGPWSNEDADGSEETYALLSGVPAGSQFQYSTDGGTTYETLTFDGTNPVQVPAEYLDTLQFKAPAEQAGDFEITVEAYTVDTDPDTGAEVTATSGTATLSLTVDPVADDVTLAISSPAVGDEDTTVTLDIRPTTSDLDGSETFTVRIEDIPGGASLTYDGNPVTVTGGVATIADYDSSKPPVLSLPADSNEDFTLQVYSTSIDGTDTNQTGPIDLLVKVDGVADVPDVTSVTPTFAEAVVDAADGEIPLSSIITSADVTDTDGSETLTLTLTGLADGFDIEGATFTGGTGEDRVWIVTPEQLATAILTAPENFSGTVDFTARPVTTENDGDSLTGNPISLSVEVTPSPEAAMTLSTTVDEDTLGQVDFGVVHQNGDTDESVTSVSFSQTDAGGQEFTLYLGNGTGTTLADAAGTPGSGVELNAGVYTISGDALNNIYVQGDPDTSGSYTFDVSYEVTDPSSDGTLSAVTDTFSGTYTVTVEAVTDPVDVTLGTITGNNGNVSVDGTTVTASGNTVISVPLTALQVDNPMEDGGNGPDVDGSEQALRFIVDGVPEGVTVEGGTYIGDIPGTDNTGRWVIDIDPDEAFDADGVPQTLQFALDGSAEQLAGLSTEITITLQTQDTGSVNGYDSVSWTLETTDVSSFDGSGAAPDNAADIDTWNPVADADVTEDTQVSLGDLIDGAFVDDDSGSFSIALTGLPAGAEVTGMEQMVFDADGDGEDDVVYTASGSGDTAALQALLDGITVTAPENENSNNSGNLEFDVTLTSYGPGPEENVATVHVDQPVDPVTDPAIVEISAPDGTEDTPVDFTVTVNNPADGASGSVVNDTLYLTLDDGTMDDGTLSYGGSTISATSVNGVTGIPDGDYYVISDVQNGDTLTFTYTPAEDASGTVSVETYLTSLEENATNTEVTADSTSFEIAPVNDGYDIQVGTDTGSGNYVVSGTEDQLVQLNISGSGLTDADNSEAVIAAVLKDVPDGYLVLVGDDEGSATLAGNLGDDGTGNNSWSIPVDGTGNLPDYIAIQAPENLSGTVEGLILTVLTTEDGQDPVETNVTFDLDIAAVADPISITPTLSFGDEGTLVPLNLNATMEDADGSETVTLTVEGAGEYAAFYDGLGGLLDATYDDGTDTYTIEGIEAGQINSLQILQTAGEDTITVTAHTVETDGGDSSADVSGTFDLKIYETETTTGDDTILFDADRSYDGLDGTDTVQLRLGDDLDFSTDPSLANVEILDLETSGGDHTVGNLTLEDVLDITDGDNDLTILGDAGDTVDLDVDGANWSTTGPTNSGGVDTYVYTNVADPSVTVTLHIDDDMDVNTVIE